LLASALGKYRIGELAREDLFSPGDPAEAAMTQRKSARLGSVRPESIERILAGQR
jgi:hypothetical protein